MTVRLTTKRPTRLAALGAAVLGIAVSAGAYFYQTAAETSRVLLRAPDGDTAERTSQRVAEVTEKALSRTALVTAIRDYGLYRNEIQRLPIEDVVEQMRQAITIERVSDGRVKVEFRGENSHVVADHLARHFMDAGFESEGVTTDPLAQ